MKFSRKICFSALVCCICVFSAYTQKKKEKNPPPPAAPFAVKANLLITDASNVVVDDIKQEDIKIFENGVEQKITSFTKKAPILNLAIVIDTSGSLRSNLNEISGIASTVVSNLRPKDEALIIRFVDSVKIEILQEWTSDQSKLKSAIGDLYIEGGRSAVLDAIYLAQDNLLKREKEAPSKRRAILLISDVEDKSSYYKYEQVTALFKNSDSQVFIVSYADGAPENAKEAIDLGHKLALDTGGTVHNLAKKHSREELIEVLKKIVFELRSSYIIGYTPINQNRDGLPRKLTVEISGEKRNAQHRDGYTVPKEK